MKDGGDAGKAIGVSAGVAIRQRQVLVCKRRGDQDHPGRWEFPGGKIEPGETPEQCLRREIAEELGAEVVIGELLARHRHAYPDGPTVDLWFFALVEIRSLQNRVFAEVRWVPLETLATLDLLEADRPIVELLLARAERS